MEAQEFEPGFKIPVSALVRSQKAKRLRKVWDFLEMG
jgi:hypothetical protein